MQGRDRGYRCGAGRSFERVARASSGEPWENVDDPSSELAEEAALATALVLAGATLFGSAASAIAIPPIRGIPCATRRRPTSASARGRPWAIGITITASPTGNARNARPGGAICAASPQLRHRSPIGPQALVSRAGGSGRQPSKLLPAASDFPSRLRSHRGRGSHRKFERKGRC